MEVEPKEGTAARHIPQATRNILEATENIPEASRNIPFASRRPNEFYVGCVPLRTGYVPGLERCGRTSGPYQFTMTRQKLPPFESALEYGLVGSC